MVKNILITSAGRRVELINAFKAEVMAIDRGIKVHAIDANADYSSACYAADVSATCPLLTSPDYEDFLKGYVTQHNIGLIIPTIDTELLLLARLNQTLLELGAVTVISLTRFVEMCRDKRLTKNIFSSLGIHYPEIYQRESLQFPCFAKPYNGSCSQDTFLIKAQSQLTDEVLSHERLIFMEYIDRDYFDEYTVDAYYSDGKLICLVPRKRIEVISGEISKGITEKSWLYELLKVKLQFLKGAIGCITLQFFVNNVRQECIGLEINPRFGGGYPLSYAAGANYPKLLIHEYLLDEKPCFFEDWEDQLLMLRYTAMELVRDVITV